MKTSGLDTSPDCEPQGVGFESPPQNLYSLARRSATLLIVDKGELNGNLAGMNSLKCRMPANLITMERQHSRSVKFDSQGRYTTNYCYYYYY